MDCKPFPEMDLGDWGQLIQEQLQGQRYPLNGMLELTERCNFNCVHCYINQPANDLNGNNKEMTTSQIKEVLDQITDAGCFFLTFTGGEPLLRPDFEEIYSYAKRLGTVIRVFTNGSMITPRIANLFQTMPPREVDITIYGASSETYDQVTRFPGGFERTVEGLKLLKAHGVAFSLKTMVLTINQHELPQMRAFAKKLGAKFRTDSTLWPRLDGTLLPLTFQIPLEEKIKLEFNSTDMRQEWTTLYKRHKEKYTRAEYVFNCGAGMRSFYITSTGELVPCVSTRNPSYMLLEIGFQEAWKKLGEIRSMKRKQDTPCLTCALNDLCNLCPGWSQAIHNDNESPVSHLCELAHRRATEIGINIETQTSINIIEEIEAYE